MKKIDQETLKNVNRQVILNYIRKYREISRIDLAQYTKLSPTTVSSITMELVERNLVTETRIGESSGGRRPLMLGINANAKFAVIITLVPTGASFALVNLNYEVVGRREVKKTLQSASAVEEALLEGIRGILNSFSYGREQICGVGISLPGVVDYANGKVLYSSKLRLKDYELASRISGETGLKCFIFKDTDVLILGEYNFGIGSAYKNLIYIDIEHGVGMSYINSGRLFLPGYGGGFELGHITIDSNGPECRCGNRGCLGTVVSEQPARNKIKKLIEKDYETQIEDAENMSLSDIVMYSNKNDKVCRYVLEEQARVLGTAIASMINLFNPELVIIGGPLKKCEWGFLDIVRNTVKDRALYIYSSNTVMEFAKLGEESSLLGMVNEIYEKEIFGTIQL